MEQLMLRGFAAASPKNWRSSSRTREPEVELDRKAHQIELDRTGCRALPYTSASSGERCEPSAELGATTSHILEIARGMDERCPAVLIKEGVVETLIGPCRTFRMPFSLARLGCRLLVQQHQLLQFFAELAATALLPWMEPS